MASLMTLSVSQVMDRTGFSRCRVYRLIKLGKLSTIREGKGAQRVLEASLIAYFDQQTVGPVSGVVAPSLSKEARRRAADLAVLPEGENPFA